ncbi:MAG: spondin domain-containing protein [Planctomycetota bacterium]
MKRVCFSTALTLCLSCFSLPSQSHGQEIRVRVENTGAVGGTAVAPVFLGVHDGTFNLFTGGQAASSNLQTLAELGGIGGVITDFENAGFDASGIQAPLAPGDFGEVDFTIDASSLSNNPRLLVATMLLPSNDWFLSSENTGGTDSGGFDLSGLQVGETRVFTLDRLYDAGSEAEDFAFSPGNPFIGLPPGDAAGGNPGSGAVSFLGTVGPGGTTTASFADFDSNPGGVTASFSPLTITVTAVPEPGSILACGVVAAGLCFRRRRR